MCKQPVRFAILNHDHPFMHWDLLIEQGEQLLSWRLLREPANSVWISAEALPPHRKIYLTYEGPVSGGRGTVSQWDNGTCIITEQRDDKLSIIFRGNRISGPAVLEQIVAEPLDENEPTPWRFRWIRADSDSQAPDERR
jgi:hypothetical protein